MAHLPAPTAKRTFIALTRLWRAPRAPAVPTALTAPLTALLALVVLTASLLPTVAHAQTAPTVTSVSITSSPESGQTYRSGETIKVWAVFSSRLSLLGSISSSLQIGSQTRTMILSPTLGLGTNTDGTSTAHFEYIVQSDDLDTDGVSIPTNPFTVSEGGSVARVNTQINADLSYAGLSDQSAHKVDGSVPGSVEVSSDALTVGEGDAGTYTVKLSKAPTADVTIAITKESGGDADLSVAPTSLTFTTTTWDTGQTVTVTASTDTDSSYGRATFKHTASSTDTGFNDLTASVVVQADTRLPRLSIILTEVTGRQSIVRSGSFISVNENAGTVVTDVTLSRPSTSPVTVDYATAAITSSHPALTTPDRAIAIAGKDYSATSGQLTFAPGDVKKTISVPIIDDSLFLESDRFFEVVLSNPSSGASLSDTQEKVLISLAEDDPAPTMTVAAAGLSATSPGRLSVKEGDSGTTEVTFTVTQNQRRLPRTRNLNVQVVASGTTAAAGSDFAALDTNTTLEFAAGEASKTFTVTINGDTTAEEDETIGLSFLSGQGNFINSASLFFDVTITILDDDGTPSAPAAPALTAGNAQLSVQWSAPTDDGGVAITDYDVRHRPTTPSDSSWTELADTTPSTATTATISSLTNGTVYEVQVRAQNENGAGDWSASAEATPSTMTLSYTAAPTTLTVNTAITTLTATTSGVTGTIAYTANPSLPAGLSLNASTGAISGTPTAKSTSPVTVTVTATAGSTTAKADILFPAVAGEPLATPVVTLDVDNGRLIANWAAVTGVNNYVLQWKASTVTDWAMTGVTTVNAGGSSSTRYVIPVLTNGTAYDVRVQARAASASTTRADSAWSAAVSATPTMPTLSIAVVEKAGVDKVGQNILIEEDVGTVDFTVTLSAASTGMVTVDYATEVLSDNDRRDAIAGEDYTAVMGTLTFAPGETSKTISVQILDDTVHEDDEFFRLGLSNPSAATIAANRGRLTLGITNADSVPPVTVTAEGLTSTGKLSVPEGDADADITFTFTQASAAERAIIIGTFGTDGTATATADTDFEVPSPTLSIAAGQTQVQATVKIKGDTDEEGDETFNLLLIRGGGIVTNSGGARFRIEVTILDDDGVPAAPAAPRLASSASGQLTASWLPPTDTGGVAITDYDVRYRVNSGSPKPDWTEEASATAASTALMRDIGSLVDGTEYEVQVRAQNENGEGAWSPSATATPSTMLLTYASQPTTLQVGDTITDITATVAGFTGTPTYGYAVTSGTLPPGLTLSSTTGTISGTPTTANASRVIVTITVTAGSETASTNIVLPAVLPPSLSIMPASGQGNFLEFMSTEYLSMSEEIGSGQVVAEVRLSSASLTPVTVEYVTEDLPDDNPLLAINSSFLATAGEDYVAQSGTLTFAPGQTLQTITVPVMDDDLNEYSDEFFRIRLSNPMGATLPSGMDVLNIGFANSDPFPPITITAEGLTGTRLRVTEGDSGNTEVTFTFTQAVPVRAGTATLNSFINSSGTAEKNEDFTSFTPSGARIDAGMTTATVTLPIIGDTNDEDDETISLEFSSPSGGRFTNPGSFSMFGISTFRVDLTIVDDDGVPAAPAAPVLVPKGAGLDVSWLPPTDTGGMAITDYDVRHGIKPTSGDPATWTELTDTSDSTALSATISGLTNGTTYVVQVRAQNENGNGVWSASATATPSTMTLSYTTPPTTLTVNTPITALTATTSGISGTIAYTVSPALPPGLSLNATNGTISGTPTTASTSPTSVTVTATAGSNTATAGLIFPAVDKALLAAPANLVQKSGTTPTKSGFAVIWDAVSNAVGYTATATSGFGSTSVMVTSPTREAVFTGLRPGVDYTVTVTATGNANYADSPASTALSLTTLTNSAPSITSIADQMTAVGTDLLVNVDATDADAGDTLRYRATSSDTTVATVSPTSLTDLGANSQVTVTPVAAGTASITVTVRDSVVAMTELFKVTVMGGAPQLSYPALPRLLRAGVQFETLTPTPAGFTAGANFTYAVTTGTLPSGLKLDANTGAISGMPDTPKGTRTSVTVTVTGTTGTGMSTQTETATATLDFPRIFRFKLPAPTVTLAVGNSQLTANWEAVANADTYALQWKASSVTSWTAATGVTTVDPATPGTVITGLTSGTTYDVRVRSKAASSSTTHIDGDWSSAVQGVPAANSAPTVANMIPDQTAPVGVAFSFTLPAGTFSDADSDSLTYTASKSDDMALPTWLNFTDDTRTFSGTPQSTDTGTLSVKVTASDGNGGSVSDTFDIEVSVGPALVFTPTALTVVEGRSGTYRVKLATQPAGNVTVTVDDTVSTEISVDTDFTMTGDQNTLTFTTDNWFMERVVRVNAGEDDDAVDDSVTLGHTTTGYSSVSGNLVVTVDDDEIPNRAPSITDIVGQTATFGTDVRVDVDATDADDDSLQYRASSGDTTVATVSPTTLTAHSNTSQVTVTPVGAGTATITVTVSDGEEMPTETFDVVVSRATLGITRAMLARGNGQLTPSWEAVTGAGSYALQYKLSSVTGWSGSGVTTVDPATSGTAITGLTNEMAYDVRVRAKAASSSARYVDGRWSGGTQGIPTATPVPTALAASFRGNPPDTSRSDFYIPGERVDVLVDLNTSQFAIRPIGGTVRPRLALTVGSETRYATYMQFSSGARQVSGSRGSLVFRYTFVADDKDADGISVPENAIDLPAGVSITARDDATLDAELEFAGTEVGGVRYWVAPDSTRKVDNTPLKASGLTLAKGSESDKVVVTWNKAGYAPNGYSVRWRKVGGSALSAVNSVEGTPVADAEGEPTDKLGYEITGLESNTAYFVRLDTRNGADTGVQSKTNLTERITTAEGPPSAPVTPTVTEGDAQLTVGWSAPTNNGGSAITDYDVRYRPTTPADGAWTSLDDAAANATDTSTTATITGLTNGTEYEVQVRAQNANGEGFWSASVRGTPGDVSLAYTAVPDTLAVGTMVSLTATATGFDNTPSYALTTGTWPPGLTLNSTTGAVTGTLTTASTTAVTVTVTATAGTGTDTQTATADITFPAVGKGTLATPTGLALKADTQSKTGFTVSWTAVENAMGYTATATPSGGSAVDGTVSVPSSGPEAAFTSLTAGTTYTVSVVATGNANYLDSTAATLSQATSANSAPTVANAIADQTATVGVAFSFTLPAGTFSDVDSGDMLTYTAMQTDGATDSALPTWLSFTAGTGVFSGTPTSTDTGTLSVKVTASDGTDSVSDTFDIVVSAPALVFTPTALTVNEGGSGTYTVALAAQPTADVTVTIGGTGRSDVTVDTDSGTAGNQSTLTFTTMNWDTAQTVTVSAAEDADAVDDSVTLSHTAANGGYGSVNRDLVVTVNDDDTPGLVFTPTALTVDEGESGTYTVALATQPSATVTVTVTGSGDVSVSPTSLTFSNSNWGTAQTVTVSAAEDADTVDDSVTLNHTAANGGYGSVTGNLVVTVDDDDSPGLVFTPTALTVDEGASGTYTVALTTQPSATVTVTVGGTASSDVTVDTDTGTTGNQNTLTFSNSTWDTAQTVTVSAAEDADAIDDSVTLSHTAANGGYGSVTGNLVVTVDDDDQSLTYTAVPTTMTVGTPITMLTATATNFTGTLGYSVTTGSLPAGLGISATTGAIAGAPTAASTSTTTVTVTATAGTGTDVQTATADITFPAVSKGTLATPANLMLKADTQSKTGFTVTWTAVTGATGYTATAVQGSNTFTGTVDTTGSNPEATFTGLAVNTTYAVSVVATGNTANYEASTAATLSQATAANAVPTVANAIADRTATVGVAFSFTLPAGTFSDVDSGDSLTYTASKSDDMALPTWLSFAAGTRTFSGTPQSTDTGTLSVKVTASDGTDSVSDTFDIVVSVAPALVFTPTALTVDEGGSGTYTVALAAQPSATVTVTVAGSGDVSVSPTSLTFTATTWSTAQTVTASAAEDTDTVDDSVTLSHTAANGGYGSVTGSLVVTVDDDDQSLTYTAAPQTMTVGTPITALTATATGFTGTLGYSVTTGSLPAGLGMSATTGEITGAPTAASTSTTTVTVTATAGTGTDAQTATRDITFPAVGKGTLATPTGLGVKANSKSKSGFTITWNAVANAAGYTATARASNQPDVTVTLSTAPANPEAVFTGLAVNTIYTVTVIATGNANYDNSSVSNGQSVTTLANSAPTVANAIADQTATVRVAFSYAFPANSFADTDSGDTLTYTASKSDDMALPTWLSFAAGTRTFSGTPQSTDTGTLSVKVTASDGTDSMSDTFDIVVSVAPALVFTPTALTVDEGGSGTYTVALATQPTADVTVTVGGTASSDVTVDTDTGTAGNQNTLTFSNSNWDTAQTVTVSAAEDTDTVDDSVTLSHTAANGGYGSVTSSLVVTVDDDDQSLTYTAAPTTMTVGTPIMALTATATNFTGTLGYSVTTGSLPAGLGISATTGEITGAPTAASTSTTTVTVTATAGTGTDAQTATADITFPAVSKGTLATPTGLALKANTQRKTGFTVTWTAVASATGYTAMAVQGSNTFTGAVTGTEAAFTGLTAGTTYTVSVVATGDTANYEASSAATLDQATAANAAPSITDITNKTATFGTNLLVDVDATDTNPEDTLQYRASSGATAVATVSPTSLTDLGANSQVTVTPVGAGTATITVTVSDGTASPTDTFVVTVGKATLATPTGLVLKANTQRKTSFTVTWTAVANATGYTATATPSGGTAVTGTVDTSGTNPEAAFTGLTAGTTYTVSVVATGDTANYEASSAATLDQATAANAAPSITDITNKTATFGTNLLVDVDATDTNPEDTLQYQASSGATAVATVSPTSLTDLGANSQVTVTPVGAGTATITVTVSDGTASPTDTFVVTVGKATLATPTGLALKANTQRKTGFTVTWTAVANATGYTATATPSGGTAVTGTVDTSGTNPEAAFTGLTAGTTYMVSVVATGDTANYEASTAATLDQATAANAAPSITDITDKTATFGTNLLVDVDATDTNPEDTLQYQASSGATAVATVSPTSLTDLGANSQITVTPVAAGTATITVTVSDGTASPTDTFVVTVGKTTLATPTGLALKANTQRKTGFTVTWTAVANATGYTATATPSGGTAVTGTVDTTGTNPEAAFTGLTAGTTYMVSVVATGDTANYEASTAATLDQATAANVAPSIVDITNKTATFGTNLMVDVDATDTNPEDTLQYQASSSDAAVATVSPTSLTDLGANSQVTVTPVAAGTATITVTVSDGTASPTDTFVVTVSRAQLGTPVVTVSAQDGKLTASWVGITNAASYEVEYKESTSDTWLNNDDDTSPAEIDSLTNGTEYDVRVRAKAASSSTTYADSAWSEVKKGTPTAVVEMDVSPSFGSETIAAQTWTVRTGVDLTLPAATGGNGTISYELTPALPSGVTLNSSTRTVSGAPTAVASAMTYTWRASDSDSNTANSDTAALTFQVTVGKGTLATPSGLALKANTLAQTGFTVTFDVVPFAGSYTATATPSGGTAVSGTVTAVTAGLEASFTGLTANTTYTVSITAIGNANYNDSQAGTVSVTTLEGDTSLVTPTKVNSLQVTAGDGSLEVSWVAASVAPSGYSVRWRERGPGSTLTSVNRVTDTSFTITNLTNGQEYVVRVDTRNVADTGIQAGTLVTTIGTPAGTDSAPAFASGTTIPDQAWTVGAGVALTLPEATGGNGALNYTLTPDLPAGVTLDTSTRVVSGTPTAAASTATYTWRATDSDSNTANSDTAALTFELTVSAVAPTAVSNLQVTAGDGSLEVSWTAASVAPNGYSVRWREEGSGNALSPINEVDGTSFTIPDLTNGQQYEVRVDTRNAADDGVQAGTDVTATGTPVETDSAPAFASDTSIPDQTWRVDTPVNLTLPEAAGGNGTLSYTLTPDLPTGVTLDTSTRVVSGTPTATASAATYTWRVADSDSNTASSDTAELNFRLRVDAKRNIRSTGSSLPRVNIEDASAMEGDDLVFRVVLSKAVQHRVKVYWATRPGTARADQDFWSAVGAVVFRPGVTERRIRVETLDDDHNDPGETMQVRLSSPRGTLIGDGIATGTINNWDALPVAWLARFGRAMTEQALGGIEQRLTAPREAGTQGTVAGMRLDSLGLFADGAGAWPLAGDVSGEGSGNVSGDASGKTLGGVSFGSYFNSTPLDGSPVFGAGASSQGGVPFASSPFGGGLLTTSNFTHTGAMDESGGSLAFWGRGARADFRGRDGMVNLDGQTETATLGADYARDEWLTGVMLTSSRGTGGYQGVASGEVEVSLNAAIPYGSYRFSERLDVWGAVGRGTGALTLTPEGEGSIEADLDWSMVSAGLRGGLFGAAGYGPAVTLVSDVLWSRTGSGRVEAGEGHSSLASSEADTSRLRLGLEGSWALTLGNVGAVTPKLEAGVRHDDGDAEQGFGVEVGGGLAWTLPALGLTLDVSGRTLVTHEADGQESHGFSAALNFDPSGEYTRLHAEPASGHRRAVERWCTGAVRLGASRRWRDGHGWRINGWWRCWQSLDAGDGVRTGGLRRQVHAEPDLRPGCFRYLG